jgi:Ca2+/Na+ antiporter
VSEANLSTLRKIVTFAAVVEVCTGLALMVAPAIVVASLLGVNESGACMPLGRFLGIALFALGLACWPSRQRTDSGSPAFRAMLIYNMVIALYLAYLGALAHFGGLLLWPAVALHAVVALLLVWTWRAERTDHANKTTLPINGQRNDAASQ